MQRLSEFRAADAMSDLSTLPFVKLHPLFGDRKGQWAVDLDHPRRLVFIPNHDPVPVKPDGSLDLAAVTSVLVLDVVDYH